MNSINPVKTPGNPWDFYSKRVEPREVKDNRNNYINLRTCRDLDRLQAINDFIRKTHADGIFPWISRPYGQIEGYGVYRRGEAEGIQRQMREDSWGDPIPGPFYDLSWFQRRIILLTGSQQESQGTI